MNKRTTLRLIEPTAVYTKFDVAQLLDVHERSLQKYPDLPWSDLGEHTIRMLGSALIEWLQARRRRAA